MDGQLLEVIGAAKTPWQIDVVGIVWRSDDAGSERLAIVESTDSGWSFPRGRVSDGLLHADAFPGALKLSSHLLSSAQFADADTGLLVGPASADSFAGGRVRISAMGHA